jgi:citrate synthase
MAKSTLTITDDRTGRHYVVPVERGVVRAHDLAEIRVDADDDGLVVYDPGLHHTALCRSAISTVDEDRGTLRYRGYPVEQLAERGTYLETAYLIVKGHLPTAARYRVWEYNVKHHTLLHESVRRAMEGFHYDAPPISILLGTIAILSSFYPDARDVHEIESRRVQTRRLIGKVPTIAAFAYRRSRGLPYVYPDNDLSYTGNLLSMMFRMTELEYRPNPVLERALDVLFVVHADHAQNCSSAAARVVGSTEADPYAVVAAAGAATSGPGHGGQSERVLRMLRGIGSVEGVPGFLAELRDHPRRTPGLGHSLYRHRDPRAAVLQPVAEAVFAEVGPPELLPIAHEIERVLADDDRWAAAGIFPNADFYAALVYDAIGLPPAMFPVLHTIPRIASWMAQWAELLTDPDHAVVRSRQVYVGPGARDYVPIGDRTDEGAEETELRTPL